MPKSKNLMISQIRAKRIAKKANRRAIKWGIAWENITEQLPVQQWGLMAKKGARSKKEIIRRTNMKEQNDAYKMVVQETISKAIKEFKITKKSSKDAINKLAHLMAIATIGANHTQARQIRALIGIEVMKATKDREKSLSFLSHLDFAIQANWINAERERAEHYSLKDTL